jgi:methylmalonyl-CoA/ethylmalonyl-CoA epimerase
VIESPAFETRLHHVGFVVASIDRQIEGFAKSLFAAWDEKIFSDPLQKVRVTFVRTPRPEDALIELVEPADADSPVHQFLKRGGGLHHLCYEVPSLEAHLQRVQTASAVVVKPPLPAVAFKNRRIAWAITSQKLLLEFLEAGN